MANPLSCKFSTLVLVFPPASLIIYSASFRGCRKGVKFDGLGLGLSIVERIAKILDLSIIVTSRVGKGSVFSVTMVASNVPVLPTIEATQTVKPLCVLTGLTVLCIDDNERSLAGMQELLTTWGCQVLPFKSGKTLLTYCVENPVAIPAVILADYNLDEETDLTSFKVPASTCSGISRQH